MTFSSLIGLVGVIVGCLVGLAGCIDAPVQPAPLLNAQSTSSPAYTVSADVSADPPAGYTQTLRPGSRLIEIGKISQGTVYKPGNTPLKLVALTVRQAYVVVRDGIWVGFWLPDDQGFVPAERPIAIKLEKVE